VELDETLRSDPRLARLVPTVTRARYLAFLARASPLAEPVDVEGSPDPEDDHVQGTAAAAGATLVTGDKALLPGGVHGVRVVTVRQALEELRSKE
jgi:predicted nucleic acid-binding protein